MNQLEQLERKARLWHVEKAASKILRYAAGKSAADYGTDDLLQSAIERNFIIIGEALGRAATVDPTLLAQLSDVSEIIAFRNRLVHNYPSIDPARVWEIIQVDLPRLLSEVRTLLSSDDE